MKLIRNPELKGILVLLLIVVALGGVLAVSSGKLEQWFGITWGPTVTDSIAFVSERSGSKDIWLMDADGSNPRRVTEGVEVASAPSVSANGSRIAFVGVEDKEARVMAVRPDGKSLGQLSSSGSVAQPSFSPDGKKAAYIANGKVYVCEVDGGNPTAVLPTEEEIHQAMSNTLDRSQLPPYLSYAWGNNSASMAGVTRDPTGDEVLVYLAALDGEPQIIPARGLLNEIISQSGSDVEVPGGMPVTIKDIVWAAEAEVFTVPVMVGEDAGGFVVTFKVEDGRLGVADFKPVPGVLTGAALSPDGSELAFAVTATAEDMPGGLVVVDLDTQNGGIVAEGNFAGLSYSPAGDKLLAVQVGDKGSKRNVVVVNPDTGKVSPLTKDGHSFHPVWTPVSEQ